MADTGADLRATGSEATPSAPRRLWGGRFDEGPTPELDRINRSLPVDHRLWREDLAGSLAWASALREAGVLTAAEEADLRTGLHAVASTLESWSADDWGAADDEDIHTLVERLLHDEAPNVAGKLHTGRSRNDQVATDTRLWAIRAAGELDASIRGVQLALLEQAERHVQTVMPAYTHGQRAQPISAAHWLLAHFWPLDRDRQRLAEAVARTSSLPLGSGAVSGCPFAIDRILLKEVLGFRDITPNSLDAVGDRDWVAELLFVMTLVGTHLSRLAEDLVLFGSAEFGFVRLADGYSTGSSLMPQKRNPDAMELARGRAGRLLGDLVAFLTVLKGLPSGYNKDLQEDKSALFGAFDNLDALLPAVAGTVRTLEIDRARCAAAIDPSILATELADVLVRAGVPFREAHTEVGRLVRRAEASGEPLPLLAEELVASASPGRSAAEVFDPAEAVARRRATGGTGGDALLDQLGHARARLRGDGSPAGMRVTR